MDRPEDLALLPLADAEADRLLESVPEEERSKCWWIVLQDRNPIAGDKGGGVALMVELHEANWRIVQKARTVPAHRCD
jgi:hypothetical protein